MQDQNDQSVTTIMIIALVLAALLLMAQTKTVRLWTLSIRASVDARIARIAGDTPGAEKLIELARSCSLVASDKRYTIDLAKAEASYDALVARRALTVKQIACGSVSLALFILMGRGVWRAGKAHRFALAQKAVSKASPLDQAKQALARKAPKWSVAVLSAQDIETFIALYEKIRKTQNIPNNVIARAWSYGSPARKRILDVGRGLSLDKERK